MSRSIGIATGSTGLGSMRLRPWRSIESPSQRVRSSLKARSTEDGRRRRRASDERRGEEERRNGLWLRLSSPSGERERLRYWPRRKGEVGGDEVGLVAAELRGLTEQSLPAGRTEVER